MRHTPVVPFVASGGADLSSCGSVKPSLCIGVEEDSSWCLQGNPDPWQLPARWASWVGMHCCILRRQPHV